MFQLRVFALAVTCLVFIGARAQADGPTVPAATGWNMVSQTITDRTVLVDGDTAIVFGTANFRFAVEGKDDDVPSARYTTVFLDSLTVYGYRPEPGRASLTPRRARR